MQNQWSLVDRSRPKRSNEECAGICAKRQRKLQSHQKRADECEDAPQIRGGLGRPRPPSLGPPPNRATTSASQANTTNPPANPVPPSETTGGWTIVESDEDIPNDEDLQLRQQKNQPSSTAPVQVTNTEPSGTASTVEGIEDDLITPEYLGSTNIPTPPTTAPSDTKQGGGTNAGTGPGGSSSTTTTPGTAPPFPEEKEIIQLYDRLQDMIFLWVEECLPDTFPPEFQTESPERYWELCGWCKPMSMGQALLSNRTWAKYVYESWVWRFLHQEIFRPDSLAWAGNDLAKERGGAAGAGKTTNSLFECFFDREQIKISNNEYGVRIQNRATSVQQIRDGLVTQERKDLTTGWLVEEMLVAFYPYFSDEYKPVENAQNIEVLIRDTRFLILRAQELDDKLRRAGIVYDLILGREGDVCRISGVDSPSMQRYDLERNASGSPNYLHDDGYIALIVVPGLVRCEIMERTGLSPILNRKVVRHARAFTQSDVFAAIAA